MPATALRRRACNPQIIARTQLVPLAAAREVLDEASRYLGIALPSRYAIRLASHAHLVYAHSRSFRRGLARPGDTARDRLYVFLRHWLAARLHAEHPALFARLPRDYATGTPPPDIAPPPAPALRLRPPAHGFSLNDRSTAALFI